jgi:hypothetical protein
MYMPLRFMAKRCIEEFDLPDELEDQLDLPEVRRGLNEPTIPWAQVKNRWDFRFLAAGSKLTATPVDTAEGVVDGLRKLCIHLPLEHIYPVVH